MGVSDLSLGGGLNARPLKPWESDEPAQEAAGWNPYEGIASNLARYVRDPVYNTVGTVDGAVPGVASQIYNSFLSGITAGIINSKHVSEDDYGVLADVANTMANIAGMGLTLEAGGAALFKGLAKAGIKVRGPLQAPLLGLIYGGASPTGNEYGSLEDLKARGANAAHTAALFSAFPIVEGVIGGRFKPIKTSQVTPFGEAAEGASKFRIGALKGKPKPVFLAEEYVPGVLGGRVPSRMKHSVASGVTFGAYGAIEAATHGEDILRGAAGGTLAGLGLGARRKTPELPVRLREDPTKYTADLGAMNRDLEDAGASGIVAQKTLTPMYNITPAPEGFRRATQQAVVPTGEAPVSPARAPQPKRTTAKGEGEAKVEKVPEKASEGQEEVSEPKKTKTYADLKAEKGAKGGQRTEYDLTKQEREAKKDEEGKRGKGKTLGEIRRTREEEGIEAPGEERLTEAEQIEYYVGTEAGRREIEDDLKNLRIKKGTKAREVTELQALSKEYEDRKHNLKVNKVPDMRTTSEGSISFYRTGKDGKESVANGIILKDYGDGSYRVEIDRFKDGEDVGRRLRVGGGFVKKVRKNQKPTRVERRMTREERVQYRKRLDEILERAARITRKVRPSPEEKPPAKRPPAPEETLEAKAKRRTKPKPLSKRETGIQNRVRRVIEEHVSRLSLKELKKKRLAIGQRPGKTSSQSAPLVDIRNGRHIRILGVTDRGDIRWRYSGDSTRTQRARTTMSVKGKKGAKYKLPITIRERGNVHSIKDMQKWVRPGGTKEAAEAVRKRKEGEIKTDLFERVGHEGEGIWKLVRRDGGLYVVQHSDLGTYTLRPDQFAEQFKELPVEGVKAKNLVSGRKSEAGRKSEEKMKSEILRLTQAMQKMTKEGISETTRPEFENMQKVRDRLQGELKYQAELEQAGIEPGELREILRAREEILEEALDEASAVKFKAERADIGPDEGRTSKPKEGIAEGLEHIGRPGDKAPALNEMTQILARSKRISDKLEAEILDLRKRLERAQTDISKKRIGLNLELAYEDLAREFDWPIDRTKRFMDQLESGTLEPVKPEKGVRREKPGEPDKKQGVEEGAVKEPAPEELEGAGVTDVAPGEAVGYGIYKGTGLESTEFTNIRETFEKDRSLIKDVQRFIESERKPEEMTALLEKMRLPIIDTKLKKFIDHLDKNPEALAKFNDMGKGGGAQVFQKGESVLDEKRGRGVVVSIKPTGDILVKFENGEIRTRKPNSVVKFVHTELDKTIQEMTGIKVKPEIERIADGESAREQLLRGYYQSREHVENVEEMLKVTSQRDTQSFEEMEELLEFSREETATPEGKIDPDMFTRVTSYFRPVVHALDKMADRAGKSLMRTVGMPVKQGHENTMRTMMSVMDLASKEIFKPFIGKTFTLQHGKKMRSLSAIQYLMDSKVTGKTLEDFNKEFGRKPLAEETKAVKQLASLYDALHKYFGIGGYIEHYSPLIVQSKVMYKRIVEKFGKNESLNEAELKWWKDYQETGSMIKASAGYKLGKGVAKKEIEFFAEQERSGTIDPVADNALDVLRMYTEAGAKKKWLNPVFDQINSFYGKEGSEGINIKWDYNKISENGAKYVTDYMNYLLGKPTEFEASINKRLVKMHQSINSVFKSDKPLEKLGKVDARYISRLITDTYYLGGLGFSPIAAMKNLTQGSHIAGEIGVKWWLRGIKGMKNKDMVKLVRDAEIFNEFGPNLYRHFNPARSARAFGVEAGLKIFQTADKWNRATAFIGAYQKAMHYKKNLNMKGVRTAQRKFIQKFMDKGDFERAAKEYAKFVVQETQFLYTKADSPLGFRGPGAKLLSQFMSWPAWAIGLYGKWGRNAMTKKHYAPLINYAISIMLITEGVEKLTGAEIGNYFLFGAVPKDPGGPSLDVVNNLYKATVSGGEYAQYSALGNKELARRSRRDAEKYRREAYRSSIGMLPPTRLLRDIAKLRGE